MVRKGIAAVMATISLALFLALTGCQSGGDNNGVDNAPVSSSPDMALVNDGKLTVLISPDYPPFEDIENEQVVGFDVELATAVAQKMGLTPEFVQTQFDSIIPSIASGGKGDVGFSGMSIETGRDEHVDYTQAYFVDNLGVAVLPDSPITFDNSKEELNKPGVVIGVQTGTTGEFWAQENFPDAIVQGYANSEDCYDAMKNGYITAICTNLSVIEHAIEKYNDAKLVLEVGTAEAYAGIVSHDNPELLKQINAALEELQADGTIEQLLDKWF